MRVRVNNKEVELSQSSSVGELLESLGYELSSNTVMINNEILPREEYYNRPVREGDDIRVFYLMAGG
ncbi:MAG: sulfur carrier protein ThiS [Synergistetes bacterium]|nr:sulfur carrier protein ThiS [Synergistota bacterium]